MCIPYENRSFKGQNYDLIYNYFDQIKICEEYINNSTFSNYVSATLKKYKQVKPKSDEQRLELINCISKFAQFYDGWESKLRNMSVDNFFNFMETNCLFSEDIDDIDKGENSYWLLCYYLGIIAIDNNNLINPS
jgi:hypothetical protein